MSSIVKTKNFKQFVINGREVPFANVDHCLPDDQAICSSSGKWSMVVRGKQPPLVGILDCLNKTRYGFTAKNVPIYLFQPMNKAYPPFRVGSTIEPTQNYLVVIQYETWELIQSMPRGSLVENLGPVGDFEAEAEALYWLYSPWTGYTKKTSIYTPPEFDVTDRVEIRPDHGWQTFNVDPDGCRDIDDCFSYLWDEYGQPAQCAITIADVAALVEEGSPIDLTARKASQSLYQDGKPPRHMLPATVAEDYGSLSPGDLRLGITLFFDYDRMTNFIDNIHFKETTIQNQTQYTYESIKESSHASLLKMLCQKLAPETSTDNTDDPHNWIAALMIFYNTEFAHYIRGSAGGFLRAHKGPDLKKQEMLEAIDPDLKFLAMSSAVYVPTTAENASHHGLNTDFYTHASSPLRRYADLHNQRIFKEIYHGTHKRPANSHMLETLNQKAKDAKKYERDFGFLQAFFSSSNKVIAGTVVDLKQKDTNVRIEIWIPEWKRMIKVTYAGTVNETNDAALVTSRDEKTTHTITTKQKVELAFSYDSSKSYWKERMVYRLL